ncbi:MAG: C40 family peptidase [Acidobacteriota bacterium]
MHRPLALLLALLSGACASSGAVPRPFPVPGGPPPAPPASGPRPSGTNPADPTPPLSASESGYAITGTALALRGAPYRNGGSDPAGFDCSGFVWYVFAQHGVQVPRTVASQYQAGTDVGSHDVRAGDLVFFNTTGGGPSHVGISIGGDEFVHAPSSAGLVRVERLGAPYWSTRFVGAKRLN